MRFSHSSATIFFFLSHDPECKHSGTNKVKWLVLRTSSEETVFLLQSKANQIQVDNHILAGLQLQY